MRRWLRRQPGLFQSRNTRSSPKLTARSASRSRFKNAAILFFVRLSVGADLSYLPSLQQKQKNAVLKEAVHELQQKEKEWAASESRPKAGRPSLEMQQQMARLMETAKEREVKLRTMAGEMDTVKFHNQQLSKRVEVLQDQVAVKENKGKKAKKQAAAATDEMATALQEELHRLACLYRVSACACHSSLALT